MWFSLSVHKKSILSCADKVEHRKLSFITILIVFGDDNLSDFRFISFDCVTRQQSGNMIDEPMTVKLNFRILILLFFWYHFPLLLPSLDINLFRVLKVVERVNYTICVMNGRRNQKSTKIIGLDRIESLNRDFNSINEAIIARQFDLTQ